MTTWEVVVDMKVQKTFRLAGPRTYAEVASMVRAGLDDDQTWKALAHYEPHFAILRPVEHIIDENPVIVSMEELDN